jgi:two-component system, NarL family, nitrate/nitrite response regulator NarL
MATKVLVVENDDFTRFTLVAALRLKKLSVVCDSATAAAAIECSIKHQPNVALLDLDLGPGPTGLDIARLLRRNNSNIGIVFLTSLEDPRLLRGKKTELPERSVYLIKHDINSPDLIIEAIEKSLKPVKDASHQLSNKASALSDNYIDLMRLISEGYSNAEIAKKIFITEKSVEVAISRLAKKLNLSNEMGTNQRIKITKFYFQLKGMKYE